MQNKALVRTLLALAIGAALGACSSTEQEEGAATNPNAAGANTAASPVAVGSANAANAASSSASVDSAAANVDAAAPAMPQAQLEEIQVTGSRIVGSTFGQDLRRERAVAYSQSANVAYDAAWPQPVSGENYGELTDNGIKQVASEPVSTFSIDVDTGSYSNVRRFLSSGSLPPADAVRTEELINYFDYDYPERADDTPFSVVTEIAPSPWHAGRHLLHIGIEAVAPDAAPELHSNLVFLVDVSGSMDSPDKIGLVKTSLKLLTQELDADDSIAIVVYAGASGVVLEPTPGDATRTITNALERLHAGGSTNGAAGIELAYALAEEHFIEGGINRVMLATDGDFNVGVTNFEDLVKLIEEKRKTGISLTTLGFGTGNYNDHLMEQLADAGNGNYAYIDSINEARKVLVDELASTLQTVAKDVKIQIEFNPATVSEYRLVGYENRMLAQEDFNNDKVDAGEIGAGHSVTALYEVTLSGSDGGRSIDPLRYGANSLQPQVQVQRSADAELAFLKLRYKEPDGTTSRLLERPLLLRDINDDVTGTSATYRFAAAVAGFGQLLRDNDALGDFDYDDVLALAAGAREGDAYGYRAEFINLVKTAQALSDN